MRFWRRRASDAQKHISIIIVSSDAPQAISFRFSRLWGRVMMGMVVGLLAGLVWWGMSGTPGAGLVFSAATVSQGKAQLDEAHRQIALLSQELRAMKEVARQIRALAGVTAFDSTAPPSVAKSVPPAVSISVEQEVTAWAEERLPLLPKEDWALDDDNDLSKRQRLLFRATPSIWPVRGWVTNEFEREHDPLRRQHFGLDIAARHGSPVQAPADGIVVSAGWDKDFGWLIVVEHGYGFTTRYGHNANLKVERGERVRRGQIIALVGSTGHSSAPHLHYEIWKHGLPVDPSGYLPDTLRWEDLFGPRPYASRSRSVAP